MHEDAGIAKGGLPLFLTFEKIFQLAEKYEKFKDLNYYFGQHTQKINKN